MKILIALATLTLLASCTLPGVTPPTTPTKQMAPDVMMPKAETMPKADTMMKDDKMMSGSWTKSEMEAMEKDHMMDDKMGTGHDMMQKKEMPKTEAAMKSHGYMDYSPELVTSALQSGQKVVLFFAASWCPSCKALDQAITADLGSIGMDTLIVKVDYDTSMELKKKYGVVTQHTTVILNADGSLASKKLGARTVAEVVGK